MSQMVALNPLPLALALGALRRAATAAGGGIRACEVEILLLIAAGKDTRVDLMRCTGLSRNTIDRACCYLAGRDRNYQPISGPATRSSPFELIRARQHPHQRGKQFLLTPEAIHLLAPSLQLNP